MPNELTLTVGANTAKIPLAGTNAKINLVILRFLTYRSIQTEGLTPVQIGEALLLELKKVVIEGSQYMQRVELLNANTATVESTVVADSDI